MPLPRDIDPRAFDEWHDDLSRWPPEIAEIARAHGGEEIEPIGVGTVFVARMPPRRILKVYPPFLADHHAYETAVLPLLHGALAVPTPRLLALGERDGWPYLVMSELRGTMLADVWPTLEEAQRLALLREIGRLCTQVHARPLGPLAPLAAQWPAFIATQRDRCEARQRRTGLPEHLIAALPGFLDGPIPEGPPALLTGEYTPWNLMVQGGQLCGMFDFGDGLVGPRAYDWLGPLCFYAAGHARRVAALFEGLGVRLTPELRLQLLRLMLLHRYCNLPVQIAHEGWQRCDSFEELAVTIWPLA